MHAREGGRREKADKIIGEAECRRRGEGGRRKGDRRKEKKDANCTGEGGGWER
jgi:hypothetical protein